MRSRSIHRLLGVAAVGLLLASAPAWAATAQTDGSGTTGGGGNALIDWNPTLSCSDPFADGADLLDCLLGSDPGCGSGPSEPPTSSGGSENPHLPKDFQQNPPGSSDDGCIVSHETGDYRVTRLPAPLVGLRIVRAEDSSEIERLRFLETYPGLTWTAIEVDQPDLVAIITEIDEAPSSGLIELTLNGRVVPAVNTAFYANPRQVSFALVAAIEQAGFDVTYQRPYITVIHDNVNDAGLTRIRFRSTDPAIVRSEIALEPQEHLDPILEVPEPPLP
jgi:hypothetical protein